MGAQNRPHEAPREIKIDLDAPQAIFGSKKRANEAQESSKTNSEAFFARFRGPKELPRDPQELPKGARESPETFSKPSLDRKRFGALSCSFWELLGVSWELFRASKSTKEDLHIRIGTLLGLVSSLLAAENGLGRVLGPPLARFGAPEGLLGGVLASVKPISTIKTAFPIFDILFCLALVLVLALVLALVLVVVVSLLPCNFSSIRLGGMRGAIE